MSHISALGLFDYVAGKGDLTTEETEHLEECDDCRDEVMGLRRVVEDLTDMDAARRFLAEEGTLATEAPREGDRVWHSS